MALIDFRWPDQINLKAYADDHQHLNYVSALIQLREYSQAEALLLTSPKLNHQHYQYLLALLQIRRSRINTYRALSQSWSSDWSNTFEAKILRIFSHLRSRDYQELENLSDEFWNISELLTEDQRHQMLLVRAMAEFSVGRKEVSANILQNLPDAYLSCFEAKLLQSRLHASVFNFEEALAVLLPATQRFPQHEIGAEFLCELTLAARSQTQTIPALRHAFNHGHRSESLYRSASQVQLLQNQLADARRSCLKERVMCSFTGLMSEAISNLPNVYDRLGNVQWLDCLHPIMKQSSEQFMPIRQNLAMQYASYGSPQMQQHLIELERDLSRSIDLRMYPRLRQNKASSITTLQEKQLTIAWCSSDLAYHPVCRFIYSIFANSSNLKHRHIIVDTYDHKGESKRSLFESLPNISVVNPFGRTEGEKIEEIQGLNVDVAIDLSGWTGSHFQAGFLARIAPVQVNYLGYFASVGLSSSDYWLGDRNLFPEIVKEWHTEELYRLSRCFIAWQPVDPLPEAKVDVVDAASSRGGIRFGSFNANRKMSDELLATWARLLSEVKDASLVLKASNKDDSRTMELLRRRMVRQGLDPERIIWLPRTNTAEDHLRQYGSIDIALDTFPNGGCTTTCEALWMGVPVVTLTGDNYVGRMSTAVLNGADMNSWCATSTQEYIQICANQSESLSNLRKKRDQWRSRLQSNPLGNASDLMLNLELAFSQMFQGSSKSY